MEVEEGAVVDRGEDVAVGDDHGQGRRGPEESERACSSQPFRFVDVLDIGAEGRAIAKVVLDHLGLVVDRDEDVAKTLLHDVADDGLEQRPAADIEHRLRQVACQRARAFAEAACHDQDRVRIVCRFEQFVERLDHDQMAASSTSGSCLIDFCRISCRRSSRGSVAGADTAARFMMSVASPVRGMPRSRPRLTSPSVTTPSRRFWSSSTSAI